MKIEGKEYHTIWFDDKNQAVKIIDQTKLPHQFIIKDLKTVQDAINAIKVMEVRGAPLIGGTAAYGIVLAIMEKNDPNFIKKSSEDLIQSRPTAINLKWAVGRMMKKLSGVNNNELLKVALDEAKAICEEDVKFCKNIGLNGLKIIEEIYKKKKDKVNILTHCNAGWLATIDWGTATSPIYHAHKKGIKVHVWVDETRPRNQGASLTYGLGPIKLNAAQYIFAEQNWNGVFKDDNLTMIQGVYNGEFGNIKAIMSGGLAIIDYQDTSNTDRQVQSLSAQINANNYTVGFDYFTSDMTADNSGMVGMLKAKFGQYKVSLWYYDVPQNSTIQSSLSQDNFPNSVGFDGYRFQVGFKLFEHIGTDIRYYMQNMDSDVDISRIQLNLNVKY